MNLHTLSFQEFKEFFQFNFDEKNEYIKLLQQHTQEKGVSELIEFLTALSPAQKKEASNEKELAIAFNHLKESVFLRM